jgi:hypothetical protein
MDNPVDESLLRDTLCGIELQLIEVVEQQKRCEVQGRDDDAAALQPEIDGYHNELAAIAETVAGQPIDVHGT